jgi:hypothetical protein
MTRGTARRGRGGTFQKLNEEEEKEEGEEQGG